MVIAAITLVSIIVVMVVIYASGLSYCLFITAATRHCRIVDGDWSAAKSFLCNKDTRMIQYDTRWFHVSFISTIQITLDKTLSLCLLWQLHRKKQTATNIFLLQNQGFAVLYHGDLLGILFIWCFTCYQLSVYEMDPVSSQQILYY